MHIGLMGRIASGKNTVAQILSRHGFIEIDVDKVGHVLLNDVQVRSDLMTAFGPGIMTGEQPDRNKIATIVFSQPDQLGVLESILHPRIKQRVSQEIQSHPANYVINAAVLFKIGLDVLCEKIWFVDATDSVIYKRLREKGYSDDQIRLRLASQQDLLPDNVIPDVILENNGSLGDLVSKIKAFL